MRVVGLFLGLVLGGCGGAAPRPSSAPEGGAQQPEQGVRRQFAIAIHGGAGAPSRDLPAERRDAYVGGLAEALRTGCDALDEGERSLDVVERVVRGMEDDPAFNAGRGAVFTRQGSHELDASIMDGRTLGAGAVAAVRTVEHPISAARLVMEKTRHVLLSGEGAERFAQDNGLEPVSNDFFSTERRREQLQHHLEDPHGTVGAVALDRDGHLAAATSTGGLTAKRWGRIGDSPIVGAGTYAADDACAVSGTGIGEEFIRHGVARMVAARMQLGGEDVRTAARTVVEQRLDADEGGLIAVSAAGRIALVYNTGGMFRGACDSAGRFEVRIWDERESVPAR